MALTPSRPLRRCKRSARARAERCPHHRTAWESAHGCAALARAIAALLTADVDRPPPWNRMDLNGPCEIMKGHFEELKVLLKDPSVEEEPKGNAVATD